MFETYRDAGRANAKRADGAMGEGAAPSAASSTQGTDLREGSVFVDLFEADELGVGMLGPASLSLLNEVLHVVSGNRG
jgi:hypothetical protein